MRLFLPVFLVPFLVLSIDAQEDKQKIAETKFQVKDLYGTWRIDLERTRKETDLGEEIETVKDSVMEVSATSIRLFEDGDWNTVKHEAIKPKGNGVFQPVPDPDDTRLILEGRNRLKVTDGGRPFIFLVRGKAPVGGKAALADAATAYLKALEGTWIADTDAMRKDKRTSELIEKAKKEGLEEVLKYFEEGMSIRIKGSEMETKEDIFVNRATLKNLRIKEGALHADFKQEEMIFLLEKDNQSLVLYALGDKEDLMIWKRKAK